MDQSITEYENKLAPKIDELRQHSFSCKIQDPSITDFVSHMAVRTRHLREAMAESFEDLFLTMVEYMQNPLHLTAVQIS